MKRTAPPAPPRSASRDGHVLPDGVRHGVARVPGWLRWAAALVLLMAIALVVRVVLVPTTAAPTATPTVAPARQVAHGTIAPVSQARVGTLSGGVLVEVSTAIGEQVAAQQEVARIRSPAGPEQLTAPFAGTVTGLLAHTGDTLVPGAGVLMVADLNRLQVETTDVDEFLIGRMRTGQTVSLRVDALERREFTGRVKTVSLQPQTTSAGDLHYPVTIDLGGAAPDLRPGMSVRITLPD